MHGTPHAWAHDVHVRLTGYGRVFLGEYQGQTVAIKAVHGIRGGDVNKEKVDERSVREGMVQVRCGGVGRARERKVQY